MARRVKRACNTTSKSLMDEKKAVLSMVLILGIASFEDLLYRDEVK